MRKKLSKKYKVKAGDSLWDISERFYGTGEHWSSIYAENVYLIGSNPDCLMKGIVLRVSSKPLSYVDTTKIMIEYLEGIVPKAEAKSGESPREIGLLFKYQDTLMRIRAMQGFIIVMLLLLLFIAFK